MADKTKMYLNWSSGKDSVLALHYLLEEKKFEIDLLLTSINAGLDRVTMHGLHKNVLKAQTQSLGIPLDLLKIPENPSMDDYHKIMEKKIQVLKSQHYTHTAFGDIFLEDLKQYRENMLRPYGITSIFPLWKKNTHHLINEFLDLGYKAIVVCINNSKLDRSFLGQELDKTWVKNLPDDIDPCGENGEFHTFCFDGPIFNNPLPVKVAETVFKTYKNPSSNKEDEIKFAFCELTLSSNTAKSNFTKP